MMHICLVLSDSSSSIITVSKMLIVIAVTFEVSMGSSSSMLITCDGSGVVTVAVFCHGYILVLIVAATLAIPIAVVSLPALVAVTSFPVHSVLGPFLIRSAISC